LGGDAVEPSVPDGMAEFLSQSESATPERLSKMSVTGVQNIQNVNGDWGIVKNFVA